MSSLLDRLNGNNGQRVAWIRANLDFPHRDWCLIWPFARSDTGYAVFGNPMRKVHRLMCEYRHGPAPTPEHHAAHSCGNGHLGCVNPWHLNWKTPSENQLERYRQSGLAPRAKLTPAQVDEIRALKGRARTVDIAHQFGVSEANIRQIQSGKTWFAESQRRRPFTADEIMHIRSTPQAEKNARQFAAEFGVSMGIIHRIRAGRSYQWVQQSPQDSTEASDV